MIARKRIKYNVPIFVEKYMGKDIYKQYPESNRGYDPVFCIWHTYPFNRLSGCEDKAYSLVGIRRKVELRKRTKLPVDIQKLRRRK